MINEIFEVMKHFPKSHVNAYGELVLSSEGNVFFVIIDCKNKEDIICKLLEWCSRPIAKGQPYATLKRNVEWRNSLLCGCNSYLGTHFTLDDMYWIYDRLGNAVDHELTLKFITSGFDLSLVRPGEKVSEQMRNDKIYEYNGKYYSETDHSIDVDDDSWGGDLYDLYLDASHDDMRDILCEHTVYYNAYNPEVTYESAEELIEDMFENRSVELSEIKKDLNL